MTSHERHFFSMSSLFLPEEEESSSEHVCRPSSSESADSPASAPLPFDMRRAAAAAELIGIGCDLLFLRRHHESSIEALRDAVSLLASCRMKPTSESSDIEEHRPGFDANESTIDDCQAVQSAREALFMSLAMSTERDESEMSSFEERESLAIFDCPISLPRPYPTPPSQVYVDDSDESTAWLQEAAAVALYNLGLAHHLLALSITVDDVPPQREIHHDLHPEPLLEKAIAFYEMSESILHIYLERPLPILSEDSKSRQELTEALIAALLNNMGHICLGGGGSGGCGSRIRGRDCFEALRGFVQERQQQGGTVTEHDDTFLINALIASQMNGAPAA